MSWAILWQEVHLGVSCATSFPSTLAGAAGWQLGVGGRCSVPAAPGSSQHSLLAAAKAQIESGQSSSPAAVPWPPGGPDRAGSFRQSPDRFRKEPVGAGRGGAGATRQRALGARAVAGQRGPAAGGSQQTQAGRGTTRPPSAIHRAGDRGPWEQGAPGAGQAVNCEARGKVRGGGAVRGEPWAPQPRREVRTDSDEAPEHGATGTRRQWSAHTGGPAAPVGTGQRPDPFFLPPVTTW